MKQMKQMMNILVMASSILLLSANAYAAKAVPGYSHGSGSRTIEIPIVDTKEKAYTLGLQQLQGLMQVTSGKKLSEELRLTLDSPKERESVTIEDGNVTVQEFMNEKGEIFYRAMVNVTYHYSVKLDSN